MENNIALLLGRTVWRREQGAWRPESLAAGAEPGAAALSQLSDALCARACRSAAVVFEPEGMAHQRVETPRVKRTVFASLERIRNEHSVVSSESLGWGIDPPEPGPGGSFYTQIHSELTPGLISLSDVCQRSGMRLAAAWPAYTVAAACVPGRSTARYVLILTQDFVAVAALSGRRSFRAWSGRLSEKDWKAAALLMGDAEARPSTSRADGELRRGGIVAVAAGDPAKACPFWDDLRAAGRVESVLDLETFASAAARLPRRHPANLIEAFPRKLALDGCLAAAGISGLLAAATLGVVSGVDARGFGARRMAALSRVEMLQQRLASLEANRREMTRLRAEAPDEPGTASFGHAALAALGAAIPDALTLTSLVLGPEGHFELEAMVVGEGFDPDATRLAMARYGLTPGTGNGWAYDPTSGKLKVRGSFARRQP